MATFGNNWQTFWTTQMGKMALIGTKWHYFYSWTMKRFQSYIENYNSRRFLSYKGVAKFLRFRIYKGKQIPSFLKVLRE